MGRPAGAQEGFQASFFISYARPDRPYVDRLSAHLHGFGVPVWFDRSLSWGSQFPSAIRQQLIRALGVMVIMSPIAERSAWVEREILEGQRHDREFFPILRSGERLFLLASSVYFDARNDELPGEPEIRQLREILDAHIAGTAHRPALVLRAPEPQPTEPAVPADVMQTLAGLLAGGQFEHADILTTSIVLGAAGRLGSGWMRQADGRSVPASLLRDVDALWAGYTNGRQGFIAQLHRRAAPPNGAPPGSDQDFFALADALGWRESRLAMPRYGEFLRPGGYLAGFFPTLRNPQYERSQSWHDAWLATVMAVHLELRKW